MFQLWLPTDNGDVEPSFTTVSDGTSAPTPTVIELLDAMEKFRQAMAEHKPTVDALVLTYEQWERLKAQTTGPDLAPQSYQAIVRPRTLLGVPIYLGKSFAEKKRVGLVVEDVARSGRRKLTPPGGERSAKK